jgi:hypothetical protein
MFNNLPHSEVPSLIWAAYFADKIYALDSRAYHRSQTLVRRRLLAQRVHTLLLLVSATLLWTSYILDFLCALKASVRTLQHGILVE